MVTFSTNNVAPVADNDNYSVTEDNVLNVSAALGVLNGDMDANNYTLTAVKVLDPSLGSVVLNADGSFTYTPNPNACGIDLFTYVANDGIANSNVAVVGISIACVNDPPVISSVANNGPINEGGSADITVLAGDADDIQLRYHFDCDDNSIFEQGPLITNIASCTFNGFGNFEVNVKVVDDNLPPGIGTGSTTVTVTKNVAPVLTLSGPNAANEGDTKSYSFTTSDSAQETFSLVSQTCGTNGTLSNAAFNSTSGAGSFDCAFPDGPASSTVSVQVTDSNNAPSLIKSIVVTISNVGPTITLTGPNTANEGETKSYSFTTNDPGNDHIAPLGPEPFPNCGGGFSGNVDFDPQTGNGSFDCTFHDGPANYTLRVKMVDSDGARSNIATLDVTVANLRPTHTLSGPDSANEGETKTYSFTTSDPGDDTFALIPGLPDCTNATVSNVKLDEVTGAGSFDCTFLDGPAGPLQPLRTSIAFGLLDSDGVLSDVEFISVSVANVAPTVTLTGDSSANEGDTKTYSFTTSDPGDDTFSVIRQNCGVSGTLSNAVFDTATGAGSFDCTFPDGPSGGAVELIVADSDGAQSDLKLILYFVSNVAPTATLGGHSGANEGELKTYSFTTSDPGTDTFTLVSQSCGTGGNLYNDSFNVATGAGSFDCAFTDGPASPTVSVQVADSDGANSNIDTIDVTVANVAPTATLGGDSGANEGETKSYSFTSSDPGNDTFSVVRQNCGVSGTLSNAAFDSATGAGNFDCTFPDGLSGGAVELIVADSDGAQSDLRLILYVVSNVAPTATFTNTSVPFILEGNSATLTFTNQFDPSPDDTSEGFTHSYDCTNDNTIEHSSTTSFDCQYPSSGSFTARGRIADKNGGFTDYTVDVEVLTAGEASEDLEAEVNDLGLTPEQETDLVTPLEDIGELTTDDNTQNDKAACRKVESFVREVRGLERDGALTEEEADALRHLAEIMLSGMGC
ncbi:MAG: Ig-like domain-containing protein [Dehalococcoidia bacterium]